MLNLYPHKIHSTWNNFSNYLDLPWKKQQQQNKKKHNSIDRKKIDGEEIVEKEAEIHKLVVPYVQNASYPPSLSRDK